MSAKLALVFFLWRRENTTPEQFADYYERSHLPFLSTLVPQPSIHERSYPLDSNALTSANPHREGIFSFDSVTAVIFDAQSDFEARISSLADETKRRQVELDEARFTQPDKRLTYVAETESDEAPEYEQLKASASAVSILQISSRRPGIERAQFKSDYEAEISASCPLPGELRHIRYYLLHDHPYSYSRGVWGDEPRRAMDVVEEFTFHSQQTAEQGIEILRTLAQKSNVIDQVATMMLNVRQVSRIADLPYEPKLTKEREMGPDYQDSRNEGQSAKPWAVIAKFDIKEGCEVEWMRLVQEVIDSMKHEETFISTSMCTHPTEQGKFMLYEVWKDRDEFFTVQVKREYRHQLMERLPTLIRSPVIFDEWNQIRADYANAIQANQ